MNFLTCIFIIISFSFAIQIKFKRTFAESISVSVLTVIMILYIFTLFIPLNHSAYILCGISAISCIYILFNCIRKCQQINVKFLISFPFLLFIVCCIFDKIVFSARLAVEWDEFSHWMLVVKNMYYFNNFGIGEYTTTHFTGYPPATGLFECFFNIFSSSFNEGKAYTGLNILLLSLLISPLKKCGTSFNKSMLRLFVLLSVPMIFYETYISLYVDCILGIMFARLVYIGFSEEKYDFFFFYNFIISSSVLVLTKASGTGLYAFTLIAILFDILFFSRKYFINDTDGTNKILKTGTILSMVILPLIVKFSWSWYLTAHKLNEAWNTSGISVTGILELFTSKIPEYRSATIRAFADAYFGINAFGDIGFKCSYFLFPIVFTLIFTVTFNMGKNRQRGMFLNGMLFMFYILYTLSLLILYLFTYSPFEAQNVASFSRYMNTITLGYMLIIVMCLLDPTIIHRNSLNDGRLYNIIPRKSFNIAILIITLFLTGIEINNHLFFSMTDAKETQEKRAVYGHITGLSDAFDYKTDRIYYINQNSLGFDYWITRYTLTPVPINPNFSWSLSNEPSADDLWTKKITTQEWSDTLKNEYTFVYLDVINEEFKEEFGVLFSDPDNISDKTIYRITTNNSNNLVTLIPYTI